MLALYNHTSPSRSQLFFLRVYGICGRLFIALYKRKKYYLRTGLVKVFNQNLHLMGATARRLTKELANIDVSRARKAYPRVKNMHLRFSTIYSSLEKIDFLNNPTTHKIAEEALKSHFDMELQYRIKAYCNEPSVDDETELTDFASHVSLTSLQES